MTVKDIIIMIVVLVVIGVLWWLIRDAQKKGVPMCGKSCGGCPHPCHSDGTPKPPASRAASQSEGSDEQVSGKKS